MRSSFIAGSLALLLCGCATSYRASAADLADLRAARARDGAIPATSFEDGEDRRLSLRARSILEVHPDYGDGLCRVDARDGRTPLAIGLAVAGAGLVATAAMAASHPEREYLGEFQYGAPLGIVVAGALTAAVGLAFGSPEAD